MTIKHFDEVLERLTTGKWNYIYFATIGAFCFMMPCSVLAGAFFSPNIAHNCTTFPSTATGYAPQNSDDCQQTYNVTSYYGNLETGMEECLEWEYDTKEFTVTVTSEFNLVCDRAYLRPTFQTVYMFGNFFGSPIFGFMADTFGRKRIFTIGVIGLLSMNIISSFLTTFSWILFLRFLVGMFHPAVIQSGMILCMEVCENKHRSAVGMLISLPWAFGTMWFGCLGYLIRDWRWLQRASIIPGLISIPLLMIIDESPRWLIVKGHHKQALAVLKTGAKRNQATLPPDEELKESMIHIQKSARSAEDQKKTYDGCRDAKEFTKDKFNSAITLFKTPELRKRTLITYFVFFVSSTVFYGMSLNAVNFDVNPYLYMFIGGVMEVPAYVLSVPIIQKFGRIHPLVSFYFVCGITIMALAFISPNITWLVITFAMTGRLCIAAAYQLVYLISTEVFPTEVRTQAMGTGSFVSRIGSMSAPYITDSIGFDLKWLPSIIFGSLSLAAGVVGWFMPETLHARLYDTVQQMEAESLEEKVERRRSVSARKDSTALENGSIILAKEADRSLSS